MIHILYRHTQNTSGFGKNRPEWFSFNKSLDSILSSVENDDNIHFHLLYDGECNIKDDRINTIINFSGGSDWNSYIFAWNYAKQINLEDNDLIYIAENDYIHIKGWASKVLDLFKKYDSIDYVSLYDHPDKYDLSIYPDLSTYILLTKDHHWRMTPSTCGSVIFGKQILNEDIDIHTTNPSDHGRFTFLRSNRQRNIITPIPSLSTHCENEWLAPIIEWNKI
jgi:hypothetical protein